MSTSSSHTTRGGGGYYNLLAVNRDASVDDIKRAYKRAALIHHPDKGGDEEMFKLIKLAFEVLSNTNTRFMYNKSNKSDGIIMSRKQEQQNRDDDNGKGCSGSVDDNSSSSKGTRQQQQQTNSHLREDDDDEVYSVMSIRELKGRLMKMGIRHEDCIEKHDLIQRLLLSTTKASTVYKTAPGRPSRRGVGRGGGGIEHNDYEDYRPNGRDVYTCKGMDDNIIIDNTNIDNPMHLLAAPRYKIITMGAEAVGKSCIVKRYCEGRFIKRYISTIGIDYGVKGIRYTSNSDMNNGVMKINLFDMAGHDEFKDIRMEFYDNIQGGILVYDVTSIASFRALDGWLNEITSSSSSSARGYNDDDDDSNSGSTNQGGYGDSNRRRLMIPMILIANKVDLHALRVISREEGEDYALQNGMKYFETSANTGHGIRHAFQHLFTQLLLSSSSTTT